MRLNAKILKNVASINQWQYASQAYVSEGQANDIYIQLVDLDKDIAIETKSAEYPEFPIRYISGAAAIGVVATFDSLDDDEVFTINGTQPFADDKSIWKFPLTNSQIPSGGNLKITLTEDGADKTFIVLNAVSLSMLNVGGC